ncbi:MULTISPECIES: sensor histidine kinase [unclassified Haematobacter]|uniref:sensor histidine kinase n=1 Tax=unclassified Haematobacter TaxID=2640585 RepID=UPI0025BC05EF|nr:MULTISPECIES: ATP-binding protein [unclassified Haematobacter]
MRQFILLAGSVLLAGMIGTGFWVNGEVRKIVTQNAGAVTALYVDAMITPAAQDLELPGGIGDATRTLLEEIVRRGELSRQVSAFKLWNTAGEVVYSTRPRMTGQAGRDNPRLRAALDGQVHAALRRVTMPPEAEPQDLMEVYSPVHSTTTGQVIGAAEFYTGSETLRANLFRSQLNSWLAVGLVTLGMFAALYTLFARSARTIRQQKAALDDKIAELSASLVHNDALARKVERANQRATEINDLTLKRLSADLHDGPAQHLAFAAMRLDGVKGQEEVAEAVDAALTELRFICRGMVLPELRKLDVAAIIRRAVAAHEARVRQGVTLYMPDTLAALPLPLRNCIHRFVQETLNNSARHAPRADLAVHVRSTDGGIGIEVTDTGPGFDPGAETAGLGLAGLRERALSLRGTFSLRSDEGAGTSVAMWLPACAEGKAPNDTHPDR